MISTVIVNVPINLQTGKWDPDDRPADWKQTRARWELFQGIRNDQAVVLFGTSIGALTAQGLNVVRLDEAGVVRELTVFFRPLTALTLIAEVVGGRMAERFGPPPQ